MGLIERIREQIERHRLVPKRKSILVAVSGGVDSMALLHVLHELAPGYGWRLELAHFNHHLRGRSSDADERMVRRAARSLNLPIIVQHGNVHRLKEREGISLEMAARQMRHEFLASTAVKRRIETVALAHHADDQVELFFLRLLRGSGIEGLAGMKSRSLSPVNPRIVLIRPLLELPKADLYEYAASRNIPFREDATNANVDMQRNHIRHELLPLLRSDYQPFSNDTILRTMEVLRAETDFMQAAALGWLKDLARPSKKTSRSCFDDLPLALQRRCLQIQLIQLNIVPNFELIENLRLNPDRGVHAMARETKSGSPPPCVVRHVNGLVALNKETDVQFNPRIRTFRVKPTGTVIFQGLRVNWCVKEGHLPRRARGGSNIEQFDADKIGTGVILRHWQSGDRFHPIGMTNAMKLQDLFVNLKIPRDERHKLVVATAANGQIFWVEGMRISEAFKLQPNTVRRLQWQWFRL